MPGIKWFDRTFRHQPPLELHDVVVERLRGLGPRLRAKLGGVSPERLTGRIDGAWSVQENLGHLLDLEPLWSGRIDDFLAGAAMLRPADLSNTATEDARHDDASMDTLLDGLERTRHELVATLDGLRTEDFGRSALHPRLQQPMRLLDLCFFVAEHDDHHLATMTALLAR